ncbi:MAG: hypothetical protein HY809_07670 [Nitrospirae bacterium]|nr:hypothetical protein [Nitrospirota bacterium]
MIEKIRKSFNAGIEKVRWLAQFLAERTKVETSIFKLRYDSSMIEVKIGELYREIGKRVIDLKEKEETEVFKDFIIQQTIDEIKSLRREIEKYKSKEEEVNRGMQ